MKEGLRSEIFLLKDHYGYGFSAGFTNVDVASLCLSRRKVKAIGDFFNCRE